MPYVEFNASGLSDRYAAEEAHSKRSYILSIANAGKLDPLPTAFPYRSSTIHKDISDLNAQRLNHFQDLLKEAAQALRDRSAVAFKRILGASTIKSKIKYFQSTTQNRWVWLDTNVKFLFYQRAYHLISWYQKNFYYKTLIKSLKKIDPKYVKNLNHYTERYAHLLRASSPSGYLSIDLYAKNILSEDYAPLKNWLDSLEKNIYVKQVASREYRSLTKEDCLEITRIFQLQLEIKSLPDYKSKINLITKTIIESDTSNNNPIKEKDISLLEFVEEQSGALITLDQHTIALVDRFRNTLNRTKQLQKEFLSEVKKWLQPGADIYELVTNVEILITQKKNICKSIVARQEKAFEEFDHIQQRVGQELQPGVSILDYSLNDSRFFIPDSDGCSNPLLHIAFKEYAASTLRRDKENLLICIGMLLESGTSPSILNTKENDAFDYSQIKLDMALLSYILQYTTSKLTTAETLRVKLLSYCKTSIIEINSWTWKLFHSVNTKNTRINFLIVLITLLNKKDIKDDISFKDKLKLALDKPRYKASIKNSRLESILTITCHDETISSDVILDSLSNLEMSNLRDALNSQGLYSNRSSVIRHNSENEEQKTSLKI